MAIKRQLEKIGQLENMVREMRNGILEDVEGSQKNVLAKKVMAIHLEKVCQAQKEKLGEEAKKVKKMQRLLDFALAENDHVVAERNKYEETNQALRKKLVRHQGREAEFEKLLKSPEGEGMQVIINISKPEVEMATMALKEEEIGDIIGVM